MDLLFKRYADPFSLINQMIVMTCLSEFVLQTLHNDDEDKLWDIYLHKVETDKSFNAFKDEVIAQNTNVTREDLETTINYSIDLLEGFNPQ